MELWFTEENTKDVRFSIRIEQQLASVTSEFQRIDVFSTKEFGKILTLDGCMMITEKDEFIYHDMLVHVPMSVNLGIRRVLVIGAGDGGTVRELIRYQTIEAIDVVEIDEMVVRVCREHFKGLASSFDDPRVHLYYEDGMKFVRNKVNTYDLILVDSTDPFGPGEGLFTKEFYGNCYKALTEEGILVNQQECAYYDTYADAARRAHDKVVGLFPICKVYQAHIPTYPSGHWLFGFSSKKYDPVHDMKEVEWNQLGLKTKYYNSSLHKGAFALPNYIKEVLELEKE